MRGPLTLWFAAALALAPEVRAQDDGSTAAAPDPSSQSVRDEEARAVFAAGSTAFEDARYADALQYFQRAYELSGRPALLYNIGVAADRLRQDQVALDAFERFLAEVPEHPRRRDVEARVEVLRAAVARGEQAQPAVAPAPAAPAPTAAPASSGPDVLAIVAGSSIAALGLAGVAAAIVGIAGAGECIDRVGSTCVEVRQTGWVGVGVYGGLGLAAIVGGVVWLIVGLSSGGGSGETNVSLGPNGELTWAF